MPYLKRLKGVWNIESRYDARRRNEIPGENCCNEEHCDKIMSGKTELSWKSNSTLF